MFKNVIIGKNFTIVIMFILCTITAYWFVTYGNRGLFTKEIGFGCFYDRQGLSLLSGRLNVPADDIGFEAYIVDGKYFGYFGITPSLLRIPLNFLFTDIFCKWSKLMNLSGYIMMLFISFQFYKIFFNKFYRDRMTDSIFIILFGLGTSLIFLTSNSYVYHESIMLGGAFSLISYYFLYRFLESKSFLFLYLSIFFALVTSHTRISFGIGNLIALLIVGLISILTIFSKTKPEVFKAMKRENLVRLVIITFVGISSISFSLLYVNYLKFGNPLTFLPIEKHFEFINNKARLDRWLKYNKYFVGNPANVVHNFLYYFGPLGTRLRNDFPYFTFERGFGIPQLISIDGIEWTSSLWYSNPLLYLSFFIGFYVLFKGMVFRNVVLILGGLSTFFLTIGSGGTTQRYFHDFYPLILFLGIIGFNFIVRRYRKRKLMLRFILIMMILYSSYFNFGITLMFQREKSWATEAAVRKSFAEFKERLPKLR